jgi:penicillin G amidase
MRSIIIATAWAILALIGCSDIGDTGDVHDSGPCRGSECSEGGHGGRGDGGADAGCSAGADCEQAGAAGETGASGEAGTAGASVGGAGGSAVSGTSIPRLGAPVTVRYDARDIPNIHCQTMADCLAVQGYIQARDRLFPMDYLRHSARGTLAELIGVTGLAQDVQLHTLFVTRAGHRLERDLAIALDPSTRTLLSAFVSGINAYLKTLRAEPERLPGEYAKLPVPISVSDLVDWTLEDSLSIMRLMQFQLSDGVSLESAYAQFGAVYGPGGPLEDMGKLNAWIRAAAPINERAYPLSSGPRAPSALLAQSSSPPVNWAKWQAPMAAISARFSALRERLRPAGAAVGSNNWVVSPAKSKTNVAMLANDPHLGLQYPPLFHLSVLTSATDSDNLNLAGGTFPGLPGALVGRGANVAWGVTVVGYDVTDLYLERFLPQQKCPSAAPCVLFNGAASSVLLVPQTYLVRVGAGLSGLVNANSLDLPMPLPPAVVVVPEHGPLIQAPDSNGYAVSVRWAGHEGNTQDLRAILGLNTAVDVDAAVSSLTDYAVGAQNFLLADDQGHIAFDPHALVPVRNFADVTLHGKDVIPPWFPLPGDGSAEWGDGVSDCAAASTTPLPASCWIANDALPHGKDPARGYFFSANGDPSGVSDDNNPLAHPPYLSLDWDDPTGFRAKRVEQRIEQALAADGTLSLADMASIQADHVSRPGMALSEYIAALPTSASDSASLIAAKAVLSTWATNGWDCPTGLSSNDPSSNAVDLRAGAIENSAGCFFFHQFLRTLITNIFSDDLGAAGLKVDDLQATRALFLLLLEADSNDGMAGATFCNDVDGSGALTASRTCAEQVNRALVCAYDALTGALGTPNNWLWGRVHTVKPVSLASLSTPEFAPGPFARAGGAFTVDVGTPSLSQADPDFAFGSAASVRHISLMDPATPVVKMQLPGPERDAPYSAANGVLLDQWLSNTYFDLAFARQDEPADELFTSE